MLLYNFPNHRTKDFHFGENRPVRMADAGTVVKGVWDSMKRDTAAAKEASGKIMTWLRKPFYAESTTGFILKSPFILTRKLYEGVMGFNRKTTAAAKAIGGKVGERLKDPFWSTVDTTRNLTRATLKAGWQLTGAPAIEIARANAYEFPKRALVDQFRTFFKGVFGTAGAFLGRSRDAIVRTALYPFSIINSTRKAAKNVLWDAPNALLHGNFKKAAKSALIDPAITMANGIGGAPLAIAKVPYHTAMEAGVFATDTAVNAGRAMMAPGEGIINAYGAMSKSRELITYLKGSGTVEKYRARYRDILSGLNPFDRYAAVAA